MLVTRPRFVHNQRIREVLHNVAFSPAVGLAVAQACLIPT
jgi:hypothetical protein